MEKHQIRKCVQPGARVRIAVKENGVYSKDLIEGTVLHTLTNSATHPRGIKVRLENGKAGRVQQVLWTAQEVQ